MTEQDPYGDPTRVDVPVSDPTMPMPAAGGPPPGGPPPPTDGPPPGRPDRRWWLIGGLLALVVAVGLLALLLGGDDDETASTATTSSTTSTTAEATTSTTSTTASTTTSAPTTTSTTSPPATVAPGLCTSGAPDDPEHSVQVLHQAFALGDRDCASALATPEAVEQLFAIPGSGADWTFQGCTDQDVPDPHTDCAFTHPGGATHFLTRFSDTDGWVVFEVFQTAD